jgi:hypothetical protein
VAQRLLDIVAVFHSSRLAEKLCRDRTANAGTAYGRWAAGLFGLFALFNRTSIWERLAAEHFSE